MIDDLLKEDFERESLLCSIYLREDEEKIINEINTTVIENPEIFVKINEELIDINNLKNKENGILFL